MATNNNVDSIFRSAFFSNLSDSEFSARMAAVRAEAPSCAKRAECRSLKEKALGASATQQDLDNLAAWFLDNEPESYDGKFIDIHGGYMVQSVSGWKFY